MGRSGASCLRLTPVAFKPAGVCLTGCGYRSGEIRELVTLFSVSYSTAVTWLGPFDFMPWQLRAYQLSCSTSVVFHVVFGGWCADVISIRLAFPLALALVSLYFAAFNATNVLILLKHDDAFLELDFHSAMGSSHHQGANHLALLHAKRARWN